MTDYNPFLKPYCLLREHDWVDDPFMGDGQECARCGAFDNDHKPTKTLIVEGALIVGFLVGLGVGAILTAVLLA